MMDSKKYLTISRHHLTHSLMYKNHLISVQIPVICPLMNKSSRGCNSPASPKNYNFPHNSISPKRININIVNTAVPLRKVVSTLNFEKLITSLAFHRQQNGLYTVMLGDRCTGMDTKLEDQTDDQLLALLKAFFEILSE